MPTCLPNAPSLHHSAIASTIAFAANSFASASVVPNLSPRAMKSSSLMFSVLSVVAQNIEQVALLSVHHRDDLKAASEPKAAANLTELLFVVDVFLEAESTAQEQKLFFSMLLHMPIPRILALACDQNASDRQLGLFFDEMHASHRCATDTRSSRPGAPSHQAERGCSGLSPIR